MGGSYRATYQGANQTEYRRTAYDHYPNSNFALSESLNTPKGRANYGTTTDAIPKERMWKY